MSDVIQRAEALRCQRPKGLGQTGVLKQSPRTIEDGSYKPLGYATVAFDSSGKSLKEDPELAKGSPQLWGRTGMHQLNL